MGIDISGSEVVGVILKTSALDRLYKLIGFKFGDYFDPYEITDLLHERLGVSLVRVDHAFNQWSGEIAGYYLSISRLEGGEMFEGKTAYGIFGSSTRLREVNDAERAELDTVLDALGQDEREIISFVAISLL